MNNGTKLGDEKLDKYVYFADVKNRYGQSNLDLLSPSARKCYEDLVDGADMKRKDALTLVENLSTGEKAIIASEVFAVVESTSKLKPELVRSYTEFCIKANMIEDALKKLMGQPVEKYDAIVYAQLLPFISKLSKGEATEFNSYLSKNSNMKTTIERQAQVETTLNKKR